MKKKILITACLLSFMIMKAQKESLFLVNDKQKKLLFNSGQSANLGWYTLAEKMKDTVLQKTFVSDKKKFDKEVDSLKKDGFNAKFKKENVSDLRLTLKLTAHRFFKTDTLKKDGNRSIADSIFVIKMTVNINSEKEKLNKNRAYDQKYTTLNKAKIEEKIKKYKDFTLIKYTDAGILELNLLFDKLLMINPKSFYNSFESGEREFF